MHTTLHTNIPHKHRNAPFAEPESANSAFISVRCNIYISHLCYNVSVRLSVRLSVTEVHWRIVANVGFKLRSQFTMHCGRGAWGHEHRTIYSSVGAREGIIAGKSGGIISRYASHC